MNNIEKIKFICSFLCSHLHSGYIINLNERLEATENEDTQRLVTEEIEMLKGCILYFKVSRKQQHNQGGSLNLMCMGRRDMFLIKGT